MTTRRRRAGALALFLVVTLTSCTGRSRVPEGDQPTAGPGWRLLGHAKGTGEVYRTGVATTDEQLTALWRESGLRGDAPTVHWQAEIVVWFGAVYGSSCPVRLSNTNKPVGVPTQSSPCGPVAIACTERPGKLFT